MISSVPNISLSPLTNWPSRKGAKDCPNRSCAWLQIGYFRAKQAFFTLTELPPEDTDYLYERYFPERGAFAPRPIRLNEHYAQRRKILFLFGYRLWTKQDSPSLIQRAEQLARLDVTPTFMLTELVIWLNQQRIVRPG
ncbi:DUF4158 domain-containing protein [Mycoavidus cysteinexigens]|uniref:DUF4158 domain-containing protein n=1 Tax=Mycoavidus cysteinexigens TaxID=1553431 RepID=UPI0005EFB01C|nr:DUF4158 domain-containing protein [Mycoavidus cysteinexigens]